MKLPFLCSLGLHWWDNVRVTPANEYDECRGCGERRTFHLPGAFMDPVDRQWLAGGAWSDGYSSPESTPTANTNGQGVLPYPLAPTHSPVTHLAVQRDGFGPAPTPTENAWKQAYDETLYGSVDKLNRALSELWKAIMRSLGLEPRRRR